MQRARKRERALIIIDSSGAISGGGENNIPSKPCSFSLCTVKVTESNIETCHVPQHSQISRTEAFQIKVTSNVSFIS